MAETILSVIQRAASEIGFPEPSSITGSGNTLAKQILRAAEREERDQAKAYDWPELTREYTFTLVSGQASYALPADFDHFIFETQWNRSQTRPMTGPITPQAWQTIKSGQVTSLLNDKFRVKGNSSSQFFIDPTPDSGTAGQTMVYEYQSKNWISPREWAASTAFTAGAYCSYNGYMFYTATSGTTGTTAPTPSVPNDGGIAWTYYQGVYNSALADTDIVVLDLDMICLGTQWRIKKQKNLNWEPFYQDYLKTVQRAKTDKLSAMTLSLDNTVYEIPWPRVPDGNWNI